MLDISGNQSMVCIIYEVINLSRMIALACLILILAKDVLKYYSM